MGLDTSYAEPGSTTFENTRLGLSATTTAGVSNYYTRDPAGILIDERVSGIRLDTVTDALGSVVALTDPNGTVAATYAYDPYGNTTTATFATDAYGAIAQNNPFRYTGGYLDPTGLYHLGERHYDPTTGRFTQPDPMQNILNPMQADAYTYTGDDPVNYVDPSGKCSTSSETGVLIAGGYIASGALVGLGGTIPDVWELFGLGAVDPEVVTGLVVAGTGLAIVNTLAAVGNFVSCLF